MCCSFSASCWRMRPFDMQQPADDRDHPDPAGRATTSRDRAADQSRAPDRTRRRACWRRPSPFPSRRRSVIEDETKPGAAAGPTISGRGGPRTGLQRRQLGASHHGRARSAAACIPGAACKLPNGIAGDDAQQRAAAPEGSARHRIQRQYRRRPDAAPTSQTASLRARAAAPSCRTRPACMSRRACAPPRATNDERWTRAAASAILRP